ISDIIRKHEVGFTNEVEEKIGDIDEYRLQGDCIRIECISAEQLDKLMTVTTFLDEAVTVSLPWTGSQKTMEKARSADNKPVRYNKVVVTGVSDQWEDDDLKEEAGADFFRRIRRRVDGTLQDTTAVVLGYVDNPPDRVKFGYRCYRTRPYVPDPLQCHRCLKFGHTQATCRATTVRCPRCAGDHEFANCTFVTTGPWRSVRTAAETTAQSTEAVQHTSKYRR